jgi:type IV secretion system protein VirD4
MSSPLHTPFSTWQRPRQLTALVFGLVTLSLLAWAAIHASAVLFLLLNKTNPLQGHLSIDRYWALYSDIPKQRSKLIAAMAVAGLGLMVVLPAALIAAARQQRPLHGAARFASRAEIVRAGLIGAPGPSILVGRHGRDFLALGGQLSVMLSAPTRSGKGVGVVVPNLLNWPDSVVVLDIKGENYDITAGYRAKHGQAVYAFSPFDDSGCSHRWNPLTAVRTSALHRVGDLLQIGQVFFPNDGGGTSSEAFFNDQARNLFLGIGLYLLETPALPRSIGEMLRQSSGKGRSFKEHFTAVLKQRQAGETEDGKASTKPLSDECVDALQRLLSNSDNTLSSIVSTFNAPLTIFADAVVDAATSADDFRLEDVRRKRMSIYVRIPPNRLLNARPLLNLFFSQLVSLNTQQLPAQDPSLKYQCLLVNDEFTAMGRVSVISSAAAFLAGYNLRLLTVVQAMSQLDSVYGDKEARTFATNHGLQILYAPREQRDADEYSAMLGHFTERATSRGRSRSFSSHGHSSVSRNESDQRRALLLPQEFKELGSEHVVVILENCKPILGQKIRYHRERTFRERLLPPPQVKQIDMDLHSAKVQQRWRYADDEVKDPLQVELLAQDYGALVNIDANTPAADIDASLKGFFDATQVPSEPAGGSIEPVTTTDADGVIEFAKDVPGIEHADLVEDIEHADEP